MAKIQSLHVRDFYGDELGDIPPDITMLTPEQLRAAHGYWVSCHNHASSTLALVQQNLKELKRRRSVRYKELFLHNKNLRQSNDIARYNAELSPEIHRLDDKILGFEKQEIIWSSLVSQCDYLRGLCSRDQSYREIELSTYFGRGGEGK